MVSARPYEAVLNHEIVTFKRLLRGISSEQSLKSGENELINVLIYVIIVGNGK
jgi:hypothetical protein